MAVRFDAAADRLVRTTGVLDYNAAYTWMAWVYISTDTNAYTHILSINTNNQFAQNADYIGMVADGTTLLSYVDNGGAGTEATGTNLSTGTWYHLAVVRASTTSLLIYLNGTQDSNNTRSVAARASASRMEIGALSTNNADPFNGRVAFVKIYNTNLSAAEIQAEMWSEDPQRLANLWLYSRLLDATDYLDLSGNARDWTAGGTLTREDGPPGVGWAAPGLVLLPSSAAPGTYTGSGDLGIPAATVAGAGTFVAPTYTATGDLVMPAATVSGTGTFGSGVFTGSGDLIPAAVTASGAGTFTAPVYTATGSLVAPALTASGSGVAIPGGGHLRFYGTDTSTYPDVDRVRIPLRSGGNPTAVDVGAGDFTYEVWLRGLYADNTSASIADVRYSNIVLDRDIWSDARGHVLGVTRRTGPILAVCFGVAGAGLTWTTQYGTRNVGDGEPHHVALVRRQSTGVIELYVDGVLDASGTYTTGDLSYNDGNTGGQDNDQIVIGTEKHDVGVGFAGRLDDLRISNSRRYTGAFTPPASPLTADANTVGLYSFDDAAGTQAQDSSGNGVHGTLAVGGPNSAPQWAVADLEPYLATGALVTPGLTASGAGTFTAPVYTATGALTLPGATVAGTGTFATVGFTGSGDLALPVANASGVGTFTAPVYTASGDLVPAATVVTGTGTFVAPVYTGSGDLTLPAATAAGTGLFASAVYSGAGDLSPPLATLAGVGTFVAPTYTGVGDLSSPALTLAGVGAHSAPTYTASGALVMPAMSGAGAGTFAVGGVVPHAARLYRPPVEPSIYRPPAEPANYRPEE